MRKLIFPSLASTLGSLAWKHRRAIYDTGRDVVETLRTYEFRRT